MTPRTATETFWRTVADLAVDRPGALERLEAAFAAGSVPKRIDGFCSGRLLATTAGHGLDPFMEAAARAWMPWRGKAFDAGAREGWNVFEPRGRWVPRFLWPSYRIRPNAIDAGGRRLDGAFRFVTSSGQSASVANVAVLRIAYDLEENPSWPVRRVLDEVVSVARGLLLGQALLELGGRYRRAAWFALETPPA